MEPTKLDYLVAECFCAENNGGFRDILNEYDGKPATPTDCYWLSVYLAVELLDFAAKTNRADLMSNHIANEYARAELRYRYDSETDTFKADSYMDAVRWDLILSQDN